MVFFTDPALDDPLGLGLEDIQRRLLAFLLLALVLVGHKLRAKIGGRIKKNGVFSRMRAYTLIYPVEIK